MLDPREAPETERMLLDYGEDIRAEVAACRGLWLFCDGGLINLAKSENPSPHGGTWAWRITFNGIPMAERAGVLLPSEVPGQPGVSNNMTELAAFVYGMEAAREWLDIPSSRALVPPGTTLHIGCDSKTTIRRLFDVCAWAGVPEEWRERAYRAKRALRAALDTTHAPYPLLLRAILLDGHPNDDQLAAGSGKRGRAVSRHNKWCDVACQGAARRHRRTLVPAPQPAPKEVTTP